jgi:hypothetical protein
MGGNVDMSSQDLFFFEVLLCSLGWFGGHDSWRSASASQELGLQGYATTSAYLFFLPLFIFTFWQYWGLNSCLQGKCSAT